MESEHFDSNHFDEVNKFIEDNHRYFYLPEDPDDYRFDVGNEHELVEDVDAQTLIKLVKFLKRGKALGPNTIHNEVLRLGTRLNVKPSKMLRPTGLIHLHPRVQTFLCTLCQVMEEVSPETSPT